MHLVAAETLQNFAAQTLCAGGSGRREAGLVAEHLVTANLMGHDSHGIAMLPVYVEQLLAGLVQPNGAARQLRDQGSFLSFDGDHGFGRIVGAEVMAAAIKRAQETGLVLATLANAHHLGRIGFYGELAAEAGLASLHWVNVTGSRPLVAAHGGRDARLSTNPICFALPRADGKPPLLLDMATSRIAFGKVRVAWHRGETLPDETLLDGAGEPTCDPNAMFMEPSGALLPIGAHKGYGLAVICEVLAGLLSGGGTLAPSNPRPGAILNNMLSIVFDPARLTEAGPFAAGLEELVDYLKASPPRDATQPVLVPGEPEQQIRARRLSEGIPLDEGSWQELREAGAKVGVGEETLGAARRAPSA